MLLLCSSSISQAEQNRDKYCAIHKISAFESCNPPHNSDNQV